jgi:glycosyltransferase involved in cell wall biosynthesis
MLTPGPSSDLRAGARSPLTLPPAKATAWPNASRRGAVRQDPGSGVITHIAVCVCTYRRPEHLARLLAALANQETGGLFTYSVLVVDNDRDESARAVVQALADAYPIQLLYCLEPQQSIARARNKAVLNSRGEFLAFLDDDELPIKRWLFELFTICTAYDAAGVLGPVKPRFDTEPPKWLLRGAFYDRATYPTGFVIDGAQGRTGNALLRRAIFSPGEPAFRPEFVTGEDQDFFRRKIAAGHVFIWCNNALAYETVPPSRWKRSYILRKALMRGRYSVIEPTFGTLPGLKSLLAIAVYAALLPAVSAMGHHHMMRCLERLFYHAGAVLACLGLNPTGDTYVSD